MVKRESQSRMRRTERAGQEEAPPSSAWPRLLGSLGVGCGIALVVAVVTPQDDAPIDPVGSTVTTASEPSAHASPALPAEAEQLGDDDRSSSAVADEPPPDDPVSERWDELSASERIRIQRDRFAKAIAGVRTGEDVEQNLARARDALTVLRPEMHATVHGRAEHGRLEARLDSLAEGDEPKPTGSGR